MDSNQKYEFLQTLKEKGQVMMIGDGLNDALSLKAANLGVSINSKS